MKIFNITRESKVPLIGHIAFGIIIRPNSNVIQIRATTLCNMNCPFCSTDGGPFSKTHKTQYLIEPNYFIDWIKEVIKVKGATHINIDSVGEPTMYPHLVELITKLSKEKDVCFISMQSNGTLLTKEKIKELEEAGLKRIHLSIHSLNDITSKKLFGSEKYEIQSIKETIDAIKKSKIELLLAPVLLPGVNNKDIEEIIALAKEIGCRIGIQKYEEYKYSRKMKEAKKTNYFKFYKQLKEWEKEFEIPLILKAEDLETQRAENIPTLFTVNERVNAEIVAPGWLEKQMIGTAKNRSITINNCNKKIKDRVNVRITESKNNIYLAEIA